MRARGRLFFFSGRRRHTGSLCDWSSDVCSSDLFVDPPPLGPNGLPDFTRYDKPGSGLPSSCNPGSRNSTVITAPVGTQLVLGSLGTFKQLLNTQGDRKSVV